MNAAATSLRSQADELVQVVALFKLDENGTQMVRKSSSPMNAAPPQAKLGTNKPKLIAA